MGERTRKLSPSSSPLDKNQFQFDGGVKHLGLMRKRSCTDCGCLLLFIVFLGLWGSLIYYFLRHANIEQVIFPSDTYGNICGQGRLSHKPYLYFFNILKCATDIEGTIIDGCQTPQICVSQCPSVTFSVRPSKEVRQIELEHAICQYDITPNRDNLYDLSTKGYCAKYYFKSEPVGGRCIPSILHLIKDRLLDEIRNQSIVDDSEDRSVTTNEIIASNKGVVKLIQALTLANHLTNDIVLTWRWIAMGLLMTMVLAFIWIAMMRYLARYLVWIAIFALYVLNIFILYFCANQYLSIIKSDQKDGLHFDLKDIVKPTENLQLLRAFPMKSELLDFDFKGLVKDSMQPYMESSKLWLIFTAISIITLFILFSITWCLCSRIRLAIAIIEEASKAVNHIKSTLAFPIVPFLLKFFVFSLAMFAFVTISVGSQPRYRDRKTGEICVPLTNNDPNCFKNRTFDRGFIYASHGFNLFGIIWIYYFVVGLCYVTLAGTFADYYWTFNKQDVPFFALINSFGRCIRYHLGSIVIGSLLIAIVRFFRIILEYIDRKCKKYPDNCLSRFIMSCCKCCLWCLEKFIKFVSKNAYIMMALHGRNFCKSAHDSFALIVSNGARAMVLNYLSDFLLFLSKIAVTSLSGLLAYFFITNRFYLEYLEISDDLNTYWGPLIVYLLLSYILTSSFFSVYDVAVDTIFLCYLEDCSINDGSHARPYYMTKSLAKVLGKRNL